MDTDEEARLQARLSDLREPGTAGAIIAGAIASTFGVLFSLFLLLWNWFEPECSPIDQPIEETPYAAYCAVSGGDYIRALPAVVLTLLVVAFTGWVCARVVRRHRANHASAGRVGWQVALLVVAPVLTIAVVLTVLAEPLLR